MAEVAEVKLQDVAGEDVDATTNGTGADDGSQEDVGTNEIEGDSSAEHALDSSEVQVEVPEAHEAAGSADKDEDAMAADSQDITGDSEEPMDTSDTTRRRARSPIDVNRMNEAIPIQVLRMSELGCSMTGKMGEYENEIKCSKAFKSVAVGPVRANDLVGPLLGGLLAKCDHSSWQIFRHSAMHGDDLSGLLQINFKSVQEAVDAEKSLQLLREGIKVYRGPRGADNPGRPDWLAEYEAPHKVTGKLGLRMILIPDLPASVNEMDLDKVFPDANISIPSDADLKRKGYACLEFPQRGIMLENLKAKKEFEIDGVTLKCYDGVAASVTVFDGKVYGSKITNLVNSRETLGADWPKLTMPERKNLFNNINKLEQQLANNDSALQLSKQETKPWKERVNTLLEARKKKIKNQDLAHILTMDVHGLQKRIYNLIKKWNKRSTGANKRQKRRGSVVMDTESPQKRSRKDSQGNTGDQPKNTGSKPVGNRPVGNRQQAGRPAGKATNKPGGTPAGKTGGNLGFFKTQSSKTAAKRGRAGTGRQQQSGGTRVNQAGGTKQQQTGGRPGGSQRGRTGGATASNRPNRSSNVRPLASLNLGVQQYDRPQAGYDRGKSATRSRTYDRGVSPTRSRGYNREMPPTRPSTHNRRMSPTQRGARRLSPRSGAYDRRMSPPRSSSYNRDGEMYPPRTSTYDRGMSPPSGRAEDTTNALNLLVGLSQLLNKPKAPDVYSSEPRPDTNRPERRADSYSKYSGSGRADKEVEYQRAEAAPAMRYTGISASLTSRADTYRDTGGVDELSGYSGGSDYQRLRTGAYQDTGVADDRVGSYQQRLRTASTTLPGALGSDRNLPGEVGGYSYKRPLSNIYSTDDPFRGGEYGGSGYR